jgi:5'-methylthioadenosine phosphorylase
MTNMPEAKLALEAQMAYASLSMVTDYDCWHPHEESVSADMAIRNLMENATKAQKIVIELATLINKNAPVSKAHSILETSLVTQLDDMSPENKAIVEILKK